MKSELHQTYMSTMILDKLRFIASKLLILHPEIWNVCPLLGLLQDGVCDDISGFILCLPFSDHLTYRIIIEIHYHCNGHCIDGLVQERRNSIALRYIFHALNHRYFDIKYTEIFILQISIKHQRILLPTYFSLHCTLTFYVHIEHVLSISYHRAEPFWWNLVRYS